jgi:hypothetical protein
MTEPDPLAPLSVYAIVPIEAGIYQAVEAIARSARMWMVTVKPFAAVVGHGIETAGRRRDDLMPMLLTHQKLIEKIMQVSPLLPVRFGTLAPDEASVHAMLSIGARQIAEAFERVAGCVQMEVVAKWDVDAVFAEISVEEPIAALKRQWSERPDDALRIAIGDRVKQSLDRRRATVAGSLLGALRSLAEDVIAYPPSDDRVVVQAALLIRTDDLIALDDMLADIDATHGGRLSFRLIGPLAPCCFATVEMEMIAPAALDHAMHVLGVTPGIDASELRRAYHRAVKSVHPDVAAEVVNADMTELTEAYRMLSLCTGATGSDDAHRTIVVAVKRQEPAYDAAA